MQAFKHPPHQRQWGQIVVQSHLAQRRQQERRVLFFQHFPSHHRAVPKRPADGEKYPPALVPKGPTQRGTPNQPGQVLKTPLTCNTPTTTTTIRHSGHFNSPPTPTYLHKRFREVEAGFCEKPLLERKRKPLVYQHRVRPYQTIAASRKHQQPRPPLSLPAPLHISMAKARFA